MLSSSPPLGKYLASSGMSFVLSPLVSHHIFLDKKTRDKAVKQLASFFSNPENNALPETEIAKLWKGLFYCKYALHTLTSRLTSVTGFWMSDKPRVQQDLAEELSELLLMITSVSASLSFLRGFWVTTVKEWSGIDRLRHVPCMFLSPSLLNPLPEWTSTTCSSDVSSTPPSGSSYELNGIPSLFKNIPLY